MFRLFRLEPKMRVYRGRMSLINLISLISHIRRGSPSLEARTSCVTTDPDPRTDIGRLHPDARQRSGPLQPMLRSCAQLSGSGHKLAHSDSGWLPLCGLNRSPPNPAGNAFSVSEWSFDSCYESNRLERIVFAAPDGPFLPGLGSHPTLLLPWSR